MMKKACETKGCKTKAKKAQDKKQTLRDLKAIEGKSAMVKGGGGRIHALSDDAG